MEKIANYINGKLTAPCSGLYITNIEPATGATYSHIPDSDSQDLEIAVDAAKQAFPAWRDRSADERAHYLFAIAEQIDIQAAQLALAESKDTGKPLSLAQKLDIPRAAANFRFYAQAITQFSSESHRSSRGVINYTLRDPIGVVACISPWNLPLYLLSWKIAPALAAGNCVIAKPSEITPITAYLLSQICQKVGLPKGVLNIIHGSGANIGTSIVAHQAIPVISFTGGTRTGTDIARVAAPAFKKLSLELGGKNPALVFADCDFDQTLSQVVRAAYTNQGQVCLCASRIFVEKAIYNKFKQAFCAQVKSLRVGDPLDPKTQQGALVSKQHLEKVYSYIELAKQEGGQCLVGGEIVPGEGRCKAGYFIQPTVFEGLAANCRTNQEEIFGPVATLIPFEHESQVITQANSVNYGLSASVWSQNLQRCHRVAQQLACGVVWVNCWMLRDLRTPFGGVKHSGVGREGGWEALQFFTETKNVCIKFD